MADRGVDKAPADHAARELVNQAAPITYTKLKTFEGSFGPKDILLTDTRRYSGFLSRTLLIIMWGLGGGDYLVGGGGETGCLRCWFHTSIFSASQSTNPKRCSRDFCSVIRNY